MVAYSMTSVNSVHLLKPNAAKIRENLAFFNYLAYVEQPLVKVMTAANKSVSRTFFLKYGAQSRRINTAFG